MKLYLTRIALGRVVLHLGCICRGGQLDFHWAGIRRELLGLIGFATATSRHRSAR